MPRFLVWFALIGCQAGNSVVIGGPGPEGGTGSGSGTGTGTGTGGGAKNGLDVLGNGSHASLADVMAQIGSTADDLDRPRDLAFNPESPADLWVVNERDDSVTVFRDAGAPEQVSRHYIDPYALHFMDHVAAIAFGAPGTFATAQDSRNTYNDQAPPDYFMGPTLWSSDMDIFAETNDAAVAQVGFDLGSHLDMLHESPESIGIAWQRDNVYWVFDGYDGAIVRYDFHDDHGPGFDDHSDGEIHRWLRGEVARVDRAPAHLAMDPGTQLLYVADPGNNRILVVDTTSGQPGNNLPTQEPGTEHVRWIDADWWVLVEGSDVGLEAPVGIELVQGALFVTDFETSEIHAFGLDGEHLDWAPTGLPANSLGGITGKNLNDIWFVDSAGNAVYRL